MQLEFNRKTKKLDSSFLIWIILSSVTLSGLGSIIFTTPDFMNEQYIEYGEYLEDAKQSYADMIFEQNSKNLIVKDEQGTIVNTEDISINPILNEQYPKFGLLLQKQIENFNQISNLDSDRQVKIIIMFEDLPKSSQMNIINELGWEEFVEYSYNIIPGFALEIPFDLLLSSSNTIEEIDGIFRIFFDATNNVENYLTTNTLDSSVSSTDNWWLEAIGAEDLPFNGTGVNLAILDTGISRNHQDLINREMEIVNVTLVSSDSDIDDHNGHGTHCAGIAAGDGSSSNGLYQGVAPGANLFSVKVANTSGSIETSDVIAAAEWCINNNIDIMSMSFGDTYPEVYNPETAAITNATEHGIVTISSAGNSGPQYYTSGTPAAGVSSISVGAIDQNMNVTDFSSIGPNLLGQVLPDVLAPGDEIIAAEQYGSLLSSYNRYTNSYVEGNLANSDYMYLSGTSMSCPMVAGAAAVLLEAYPYLTPEGIRIALYNGAYPPNAASTLEEIGNNGIGEGIINVSASLEWLDSLDDPYELIGVLPNNLPIEPFDLLKYPGDEQYVNVSVFSSLNASQQIKITVPDIDGLEIIIDNQILDYDNHSGNFANIGIKILENASIGTKTGVIYFNKTGSNEIYAELTISIDVEYPQGRVYFDSFHGLNDYYPDWPSGYKQIDIYDAMKHLHDNGYTLDYEMQYWSHNYNYSTDAQYLTPDKLSLVDILVLQTPILPYTEYEIEVMRNFVESGGSILFLLTRYQSISTESVNQVLELLNANIQVNEENIMDIEDIGLGLYLNEYTVTSVNTSSSIFDTGDEFKFWFGPTLDVIQSADTYNLATLAENSVVAAHDGTEDQGNIVVWSDYHWLRYDVFTEDDDISTNQDILSSLFQYLNKNNEKDYNIGVNFNTTQSSESVISIDLSVINNSDNQPVTTLISGNSINATLVDPLGSLSSISLNNIGNGIYSNKLINLPSSDYRPYSLQLNISTSSGILQKTYQIFRISVGSKVSLDSPSLSSTSIDRTPGNSVQISYTGSLSGLFLDAELYGSLTPITIYNEKDSKDYNFTMSEGVGTTYSTSFVIDDDVDNSGFFVFYAIANNTVTGYSNFAASREFFNIINYDPEIDEINSYIGDTVLNDTQTDNSIYPVSTNGGEEESFIIKAAETVPFEDNNTDFSVVVTYTAAGLSDDSMLVPIYPDNIPYSGLSYDEGSASYEGKLLIPTTLSFSGSQGSVERSQTYDQNSGYYSLVFITVTDQEGGSTDYVLLLVIFSTTDIMEYLPIIIIVAVVIAVVYILYKIAKKQPGSDTNQQHYSQYGATNDFESQNNQDDFKYCIHCGAKIGIKTNVCPYCGQQQ